MTARAKYLYVFLAVSAVFGVAAVVTLATWARVAVAGLDVASAASRALEYPWQTAILSLPFLGVGLLASEVAFRSGIAKAVGFLILVSGVLVWLYYRGHFDAARALAQQKWTAASLDIGLLPFISVPVLIVAAIVAGGLSWKFGRDES